MRSLKSQACAFVKPEKQIHGMHSVACTPTHTRIGHCLRLKPSRFRHHQ